jgi:hypothetical protein
MRFSPKFITRSREEVWAVLQPLSEDPEPTLAYEEDERKLAGPEATPHAWAINTVRGVAMRAVVAYALWARRNVGGDSWRGLADASEAREVLERRLDRTVDPTRTIRSVYGSGLPLLIYLDRAWVEERLPLIFPEDERDAQLREAAWESYLLDWIPYDDVFEVVRDEYARAVEHLAPDRELRSPRDPDGFLARHLMILLWRGTVSFGDPDGILETFYTRASDTLRARAAGFVGRELRRREGQVPPQQLARLEDLWERRLASAAEDREKPATEELGAFAWFFLSGKFDETAALERLDRALDLGADVGRDTYSVVAGLADAAPRHPGLAVKCVDKIARKILERPDPATPILSIANNALRILLAARGGADEQARQAAEDLANMLISHNYRYFQAVLEG